MTISGADRPGITSTITQILAEHNVTLLDVEQVVVRGQLTLCMVADLDEKSAILKDLLFAAKNLGQDLNFRLCEEEEHKRSAKARRYAITVLGNPISAKALHVLSHILSRSHANIDWMRRLNEGGLNSLEVLITLPEANRLAEKLKQELMSELSECNVDVALQRETLTRRNKRLVVFDMDSTLITVEVIDEMARLHGVNDEVSFITHEAMQGRFDFKQSLHKRVAMLKGLKEAQVKELTQNLPLNNGAEILMKVLKKLGYKVGIISGGFDFAAQHLCERLDLDFFYANKLEVHDGILSGKIINPVIDAATKAELLSNIAAKENIALEQTIAIGDGANDALMLAKAGLGIAFHAKAALKKMAPTSVSSGGLERILYLLGMSEREIKDLLKS
jgi:phosphoserine phosphatase